jgi:hypothetical protein
MPFEIQWITIGGLLFFYSLTFALVSQKALSYLRKWLMSPIIYIDTIRGLARSLSLARPSRQDSARRLVKVLAQFIISTSFVILVSIASTLGISGAIQIVANPSGTPSGPNLEIIQILAILGVLVALMTRTFSLLVSDALIKGVFFEGCAFLGALIVILSIQPQRLVEGYLNPLASTLVSLWSSSFIQILLVVFVVVFVCVDWLSLTSSQNISVGLFRERRESLETGIQVLLKDQIVSSVKEILSRCNTLKSIRWATGGGFENELENAIFAKADNHTVIKFIASRRTVNEWGQSRARLMRDYTHVSSGVGFVRFMIINDDVLIEVLPMPDGRDESNAGMIVEHPLVVHERILTFDEWYDGSPPA